jgi:hypothetical protein
MLAAGNPRDRTKAKTDSISSSYAKNCSEQTRGWAEGEGETTGNQKSTDPRLSLAERKTLRAREAQEVITDHEDDQIA